MQATLIVFLGGGIGAALRHLVNMAVARLAGTAFPWHTFIINVTGSFVMGCFAAWLAFKAGAGWSQHIRLFLTTGICGGYTTFSAFSLDTVMLWERGHVWPAIGYVAGSVVLSILGLVLGLSLVRALT
jgi:fluoride exporter